MQDNRQDLVRTNQTVTTPVIPAEFQYFPPMEGDAQETNAQFPIQRVLGFLLKFWWIPLITLILGLGTAAVLVWLKPPTYVTRARLVENVKLRLPEGSLFSEDMQNFVGTQTELLKSTALREMTIERLRANTNTAANIVRGDDGEPLPVDVRVQSSKSSVFLLEASGSHPRYLQSYLDALMDVYLEYKKNSRKLVSGDTLASITEQVQKAERDLKTEQDTLTAFQRTNNLAIIEEEGRISGGYLARLKTQLSDLELELRLLNSASAANQADASTNKPNLDIASLTGGLDSANRKGSEPPTSYQDLELLKMERARLSKNLRPKHPKIVKLDADIERANKLVELYNRQNVEQLGSALSTVQLKIDNVQASIREWESKVVVANTRIAEAERLKINVQRAQSVYERLAMLVQNVAISRNIDQETLTVLEKASAPKRTFTQEISIVTMAGFGGLGTGLGIILLIAWRDDRFNSIGEITKKLATNVIGQLPDVQKPGPGESNEPLLQLDDRRHAYAESYRTLRSALLFMTHAEDRPRVILITSAVPNEGKSTVAANLARTLAQGGSSVVLVDADMRKGVLHHLLKLKREPGLADVLRNPALLDEVIQTDENLSFSAISSGRLTGNAGDLLLGPAIDTIIKRLRDQFEYIIIDSSPVFAADDTSTLAPRVDGTLFVVRSRFSGARLVREALDLLHQRQARVLGVVFNRANASSRSYYYYKYAEYYPADNAVAEK